MELSRRGRRKIEDSEPAAGRDEVTEYIAGDPEARASDVVESVLLEALQGEITNPSSNQSVAVQKPIPQHRRRTLLPKW